MLYRCGFVVKGNAQQLQEHGKIITYDLLSGLGTIIRLFCKSVIY